MPGKPRAIDPAQQAMLSDLERVASARRHYDHAYIGGIVAAARAGIAQTAIARAAGIAQPSVAAIIAKHAPRQEDGHCDRGQ